MFFHRSLTMAGAALKTIKKPLTFMMMIVKYLPTQKT